MGVVRQSKLTGNQYWNDILYHVHEGCNSLVTLPLNESLSTGHISGCLIGTPTPTNSGLILTESQPDTYGVVTYSADSFQPNLAISFDYQFNNPSSGNGADAVFFYFNSDEDAIKEDGIMDGYCVGFSEYHQMISIRYGMDFFQFASLPLNFGTPYHVDIIFNEGAFSIYLNSGGALFATDNDYNTRVQIGHNKFGLGARCGADFAQHIVSNLSVTND